MASTGDDCFFFYNSSCAKGDSCPFRHVKEAVGSDVVCIFWRNGNCTRENCHFRHLEIVKKRNNIPCFYENQMMGCQKPNCMFVHFKPRSQFGAVSGAQNTAAATTEVLTKDDNAVPASRSSNNNSPAAEIESPRVEPLVVNPFDEESDQESPATSPVKKLSGVASAKPPLRDLAPLRLAAIKTATEPLPKTVQLGAASQQNVEFGIKSLESIREEKLKKIKDDMEGAEQLLQSRSVIASRHIEPEPDERHVDPIVQTEVVPVGRRIVVSNDPSRSRSDVMSRLGLRCRSPDPGDPEASLPPAVIRTRIDPDRVKHLKQTNMILRDNEAESDEEVLGQLGQTKIVFSSEADNLDHRNVRSRLGTKEVADTEDIRVKGRLGQTKIVCSSDASDGCDNGRTRVGNSRNVETTSRVSGIRSRNVETTSKVSGIKSRNVETSSRVSGIKSRNVEATSKVSGIKSRLGFNTIKFDDDDNSNISRRQERTRSTFNSDKPQAEKGGIKSRLGTVHERYKDEEQSKGIKNRLGTSAITPIMFDLKKKNLEEEEARRKRALANRLGHRLGTNYDSDGPNSRELRETGGRRGGSQVTHSDGDEFEEVGQLGKTRIHQRKSSPKRQRSKPDAYYSSGESLNYSPSSESEDERRPPPRLPKISAKKVDHSDDEDIMNQQLSPTLGDIGDDAGVVDDEGQLSADDLEKEKEQILQMLQANKDEEKRLRRIRRKEKKAKKKAKKEKKEKKKLLKQGLLVEDENSNSSVDGGMSAVAKVLVTDRLGFKAETLMSRKERVVRCEISRKEEDDLPKLDEVKVKPRLNTVWSRRKTEALEKTGDPAPAPRRKRPAPVPYQPPAARKLQAEQVVPAKKTKPLPSRSRAVAPKDRFLETSPDRVSAPMRATPSPTMDEVLSPPRKHMSPLKRASLLSDENSDDKKRKWGVKTFSEIMREKRLQGEQAKKQRLQRLGRGNDEDSAGNMVAAEPSESAAAVKTRRPFRAAAAAPAGSQEKPTLARKRPAGGMVSSARPSNDTVLEREESSPASVDEVSTKYQKFVKDDDLGSDPEFELDNFDDTQTTSTPVPAAAHRQSSSLSAQSKADSLFDDDLGALLGDMDAVVASTTSSTAATADKASFASKSSKADDSLFNELADLLAD